MKILSFMFEKLLETIKMYDLCLSNNNTPSTYLVKLCKERGLLHNKKRGKTVARTTNFFTTTNKKTISLMNCMWDLLCLAMLKLVNRLNSSKNLQLQYNPAVADSFMSWKLSTIKRFFEILTVPLVHLEILMINLSLLFCRFVILTSPVAGLYSV